MYQDPMENHDFLAVANLLRQKPHASARFTGGPDVPILRGILRLYPMPRGVLLAAEINGLPRGELFGFRIEGEISVPPLVSVRGRALQMMVVGACTVEDLIGREVTLSSSAAERVLARGVICP